jgi:hypothetical protein
MNCFHLAGDARFSSLNIRRRGEMAPKVEDRAFGLSRRGGHGRGWPQRCERVARRAELVEGGAHQRAGGGGPARTGSPAEEPACSRRACGRGDRRGRNICRSAGFRRRIPTPGGCAGDLGAHRGYDARPDCDPGDFGVSPSDVGAVDVCPGAVDPPVGARRGGNPWRRARRGQAGAELLDDRPSRAERGAGPRPDHRRGGQVLAGSDQGELVRSAPAGRPEPHICRAEGSASSDVGTDVRSASRAWLIFDVQWRGTLAGRAMVRRSRSEYPCVP